MRSARVVLGVLAAGCAWVGLTAMVGLGWSAVIGLVIWLVAAAVLHDAVLVPLATGVALVVQRLTRRLPPVGAEAVRTGLVVAAVVAVVAVPSMVTSASDPANATLAPLNYSLRLLVFVGIDALLVAVVIVISVVRRSAQAKQDG